ncbi:hypothetical protein EK904_005834 [Melospiza melodia maxima]|nr:hypothetical protein EK904_005834 [Melospiza melodia maxima]
MYPNFNRHGPEESPNLESMLAELLEPCCYLGTIKLESQAGRGQIYNLSSTAQPNPFDLLDPGIQERDSKEKSRGNEKSSSS